MITLFGHEKATPHFLNVCIFDHDHGAFLGMPVHRPYAQYYQ